MDNCKAVFLARFVSKVLNLHNAEQREPLRRVVALLLCTVQCGQLIVHPYHAVPARVVEHRWVVVNLLYLDSLSHHARDFTQRMRLFLLLVGY